MAEAWQRLLTEHVPDRKWPCNVYDLAAAAQRVAATSTTPGR